ncbi:MAG: DUF3575 domain-containing protein [Rikenellaceae bacterium]|nr:DUF3575 domain-containing protein [Rikenellaceae bacterium]
MRGIVTTLFVVLGCWAGGNVCAQKLTVKTNLLYWATATPNLEAEFGLGERTTLDVAFGYNPWTMDKKTNKKWRHFLVQPEFRYWLCHRFQGHFFGVHAGYGQYNIGATRLLWHGDAVRGSRYEGWAVGAGFSYGYSWILGRRWNLEATLGGGYAYSDYERYDCVKCGARRNKDTKHYFGITKAGVSIIFMIR